MAKQIVFTTAARRAHWVVTLNNGLIQYPPVRGDTLEEQIAALINSASTNPSQAGPLVINVIGTPDDIEKFQGCLGTIKMPDIIVAWAKAEEG